jgi:Tol biopolymer transport system component
VQTTESGRSLLFVPSFLVILGSAALAQGVRRVSVDLNGGEADGASGVVSVSSDGRRVAFESRATDLVPNDTNAMTDVFVRDLAAGTTQRVSVGTGGQQGEGHSKMGWLSRDGRWLAFSSFANFDGTSSPASRIYVRDLALSTTTLAVPIGTSNTPVISDDGRYVAFMSDSGAILPGDGNLMFDVYLRDRQTGAYECISVGMGGGAANNISEDPQLSADGRYVAFTSHADDLVPGDTNGLQDVFLRDRQLGTTIRVNVDVNGNQADYGVQPSLSADGRFIAFQNMSALTSTPTPYPQIYVRDLVSGAIELASVDAQGAPANKYCMKPTLSPSGRFVAFTSHATNLAASDSNGHPDVYVRDRLAGATKLASRTASGASGNQPSPAMVWERRGAAVTDTGTAVFSSSASNLVAGDTGAFDDVFVSDPPAGPATPYCTAGTSFNGCQATLSSTGIPSPTSPSGFVVTATGMDGNRSALFFYGISGTVAFPWGTSGSVICVKSPLQRTDVQTSTGTIGSCNGSLALDWNTYRSTHPSAIGSPFAVATRVDLQAWYRDPASTKGTQLSDALDFVVVP